MTGWVILRTAGRHTMRLASSLTADGYEAWTPIETKTVRVPRANVRREVRLPIMPSYVFARADRLVDLLQLKPPAHVEFSVMRYAERIPTVADADLQALRTLEAKRTPRRKAERTFAPGSAVKIKGESGSFGGMVGKVEKSDRMHTVVLFADKLPVRIPTTLLAEMAEDEMRRAA